MTSYNWLLKTKVFSSWVWDQNTTPGRLGFGPTAANQVLLGQVIAQSAVLEQIGIGGLGTPWLNRGVASNNSYSSEF